MKHQDLFTTFQSELSELASLNASFKVALSGGLDSVVLLHLFSRIKNCEVIAHHVHHGLSDNADHWVQFCTQFCTAINIPLTVSHVTLDKKSRTSLEALAREKRYEVLKKGFNNNSYLVTGHHQDDQLETVLLALKRGAGLTGLQGIVAQQALAEGHLIRPLLNFSREQLEHYAAQFQLNWIEDESNTDQQFDRNFIRHSIAPLLKQRWPAITKTVSRSAKHCQSQQLLIDEITESDFILCQSTALALDIEPLTALSVTRRNNVLRDWFKLAGYQYPSTKQLATIWQDLVLAQSDATPKVRLQGIAVCRYRQAIYLVDESKLLNQAPRIVWQGEQQVSLGNGKMMLKFDASDDFLKQQHLVEICFREHLASDFSCKPIGRNKGRSLKKLLHEFHVAPWLRNSVPLIFIDGELVEAVALFSCANTASAGLRITLL
ncbi:tRNA(Ile)-lysidine synthase [Psychromonas marina]|uniref:tRNA(Ile)-lysidine synthase n=1 Tax=Psychromonas marina TaxID=88364 RepID=A0ABQ6DW74_9GAMM|nr:tRNA lysidine(34) synthetase TilS [Psychromonas marina]GLS89388.1 tRNA(Ile)-lysidine synthase [Psychromonas marina]